jgi:hypothetical protein
VNEFDEGFLEWFCGCYRRTLHTMPPEQHAQIEAAFYAGAAFAGRVAEQHGHDVVIAAINAHLERCKQKQAPKH